MSERRFTAACVQVNASNDMAANIAVFSDQVRRARDAGADFITTPEVVAMIENGREATREKARPESEHPALAAFRDLARETGAWLLAGSLTIRQDDGPLYNRSFLLAPDGEIVARYDKIHMFDVELPNGQVLQESAAYRPGGEAVLADLPWGVLGMTICYDMRFPELYRTLARAGAEIVTVPSAFTRITGQAHWHVLLRARAIETGSFVLAAAQTGRHVGKRESYGHALIVAPWGEILAEADEAVGYITAEIDLARVAEARRRIPALTHDRPYDGPRRYGAVGAAAE